MILDLVRFPVLTVSQGLVLVVPKAEFLTVATARAIDSGYFSDMWLVDSDGRTFQIIGCEVLKEPFWRRPKTPFGRGVRIAKFHSKSLGEAPMEEIRARVKSAMMSNPEIHGADIGDIAYMIDRSTTMSDVILALSNH
jgi:hypothetical protein